MTSRPRLTRSIPFWVLFVGSLALTGLGIWLVLDRLGRLESELRSTTPDQLETTVSVYVGQPAAVVGGIVLGAGLIGLLLTLAVASIRTLIPEPASSGPDAGFGEQDGAVQDDAGLHAAFPPAFTGAPAPAPTTAAPAATIGEDPDVEVPSTAAATHDEPALETERPASAPADDDRRV